MSDVIAAHSGGALPAAIGIVRMSGEGCGKILDRVFLPRCGKSADDRECAKLYYGKLLASNGEILDVCTAAFFKAPHSYTGEDMAEIYCHGSAAIVGAALDAICARGARHAEAGEFTRRAFLNGRLDLTEAEATADLIYSTSELAAKTAARQLSGSVSLEIRALRERVAATLAHYYAVCDYTDEDIVPFDYLNAADVLTEVSKRLLTLYEGFKRGSAVKNGIKIAVIGRPNSGKSSLFNALSGFERAIVTSAPGTTRDVLEQEITCGGALFRLFDTAGIRDAENEAEAIGIERSFDTAGRASGVICVFDGSEALSETDLRAARAIPRDVPSCAVINKSDLTQVLSEKEVKKLGFGRVFTLSAKERSGLEPLLSWLKSLIPDLSGTVVTSPRQAALFQSAARSLFFSAEAAKNGMTADAFLSDAERALSDLGKITGETADADIASEIFSRFCVGK